jgi:hypothetical protein
MDNPLGGIKRGWSEICQTYQRLFSTPATYAFEFWDYTLHQAGDVLWVVGRERGQLTANATTVELAIRTSQLFRRVGSPWRGRFIITARSKALTCSRDTKPSSGRGAPDRR